ncbi:acetyltransferase YjgM [Formosa agariphila KMM 3901]|uniref:Acetyltransferase YjgM n=1 Tax=Formosa agariphila (strain DSM 15362 / KCTC 12365 / LMG 23005 / KMM 3901 / M-2Alg 35-1) TaxID=1347342 RepID=T2KNR3_FORAG|nr:GNAT family N-acetyltransferase [Formosa agariphila]CDF80091.1 acetyltransferase YjgM [Formosa agariphila KMM 3901]
MSHFEIREIQTKDNQQVAEVIRTVLIGAGAPKVGTAYEDKALEDMFEAYNKPKSTYFVLVEHNRVIGGAGIGPVDDALEVCELQKMYFLDEARGRGLGKTMMDTCLQKAKDFGYTRCYLETLPFMTSAKHLYEKVGFEYLDGPMGETGHYSCNVWMIKEL